jgi:hypothetical protein
MKAKMSEEILFKRVKFIFNLGNRGQKNNCVQPCNIEENLKQK